MQGSSWHSVKSAAEQAASISEAGAWLTSAQEARDRSARKLWAPVSEAQGPDRGDGDGGGDVGCGSGGGAGGSGGGTRSCGGGGSDSGGGGGGDTGGSRILT